MIFLIEVSEVSVRFIAVFIILIIRFYSGIEIFFEIERFDLYRGEICEPRSGSGGVIRFLERYVIVLMCD